MVWIKARKIILNENANWSCHRHNLSEFKDLCLKQFEKNYFIKQGNLKFLASLCKLHDFFNAIYYLEYVYLTNTMKRLELLIYK